MIGLLPEAPGELVHDGVVMGRRFVVHGPTAIGHFQLAAVHQVHHVLPGFGGLLLPPFPEETGFDLDESGEIGFRGGLRR